MSGMGDTGAAQPDGRLLAGPDEFNPAFIREWEAMDPEEYAFSLRDIPDHILDSAPEDDLPEHIWLTLAEAEAARMPDPLTDPGGLGWPRPWPGWARTSWVMPG